MRFNNVENLPSKSHTHTIISNRIDYFKMIETSAPQKREAFSINLDEDFEIYGISPDVDLDDWSFLDAKPEPIPEMSDEDKKLFEQLVAPSITDDEAQSEIHNRLKTLLDETDRFLQNDVRVELSTPIEISPEQANTLIDKDSFEHKQAEKVSNMVKDIIHVSQKSEDIDDFIKNVTKSDEVAVEIEKENSRPSTNNIEQNESNKEELEDDKVEQPKVVPEKKEHTLFLNRYLKKQSDVMKEHDETERLSTKFLQERMKRREEDEAELKRKQEEMERKQKEFFKSLEVEAEKHRREVQMIKDMKENHAPSFSEMISNIQKKPQQYKQVHQKNIIQKPKQPVKEQRMNEGKINEFYSKREQMIKPFTSDFRVIEPLLVVDLKTDKEQIEKPKHHRSNNFKNDIYKKLNEKLIPAIKKKLQHRNDSQRLRIAIFMRLAYHLRLNQAAKALQKEMFLKRALLQWNQKKVLQKLGNMIAATKIQRTYKSFIVMKKAKEAQKRAKEAEIQAKKEIGEQQLIQKTRELVEQRAPGILNRQEDELIEISSFSFDFPELPDFSDIDLDWIDDLEDINLDDFDETDQFLAQLPDAIEESISPIRNTRKKPKMVVESESLPLEMQEESFLSEYNSIDFLNKKSKEVDLKPKPPDDQRPPSPRARKSHKQPNITYHEPDQEQLLAEYEEMKKKANSEGYNFENPRTQAMMKKMIQRRTNIANPYKNESPIDKFHRLYGNNNNSGGSTKNHFNKYIAPAVRRSEFRYNDSRTRRLMKLKQIWLNGPDSPTDRPPSPYNHT